MKRRRREPLVGVQPGTLAFAVILALSSGGCSAEPAPPEDEDPSPATAVETGVGSAAPLIAAIPPERRARLLQSTHADWEEILESRVVRALVARSRTSFFLDGGRQRGFAAEALYQLEQELNKKLGFKTRPLHVAAIPVPRDKLIEYLVEGRGDIAVGDLTVTPGRQKQVDFLIPVRREVSEVVVTGPAGPQLGTLEDLAGRRVRVRASSSFENSLQELNDVFGERGLELIEIVSAAEDLATEDLLEMVHAGLVRITNADEYLALFWQQLLPGLVVHRDLVVGSGREIAWAVRKGAPRLKEELDPFIREFRHGTLLGNTWHRRYLQERNYLQRAFAEKDQQQFRGLIDLFRKYGERYDLDPLVLAALGYQESGLDQSVRSPVGAVGVMQVMPATAADPAIGIPDIEQLEPNIHAGAKYLRFVMSHYFSDPAIDEEDRLFLALASYNAGPNRINRLRSEAAAEGRDPNQWFGNVELVVERRVGREPIRYVGSIYKYYIAYGLLEEQEAVRRRAISETVPDEG